MGVVTLDGDDVRMTVMSRIKAAAKRRDLVATFIRSQDDTLHFRLVHESDYTPRRRESEPETEPEPPPQKRRSRKPKAVASDVPPTPPQKKRGRPKKATTTP